jgi:hypothetical protein
LKLYKELGSKMTNSFQPTRFDDEVSGFHEYFEKNVKQILGLEDDPKIIKHHENIEGKQIDYLVVDGQDRVFFVEIKLGKNQENRRDVISQIIEYWSRCQSYTSDPKLSQRAKDAIEKGYVNPIIITDEMVDDHRYILPTLKLGGNNIKIRLIEINRWDTGNGMLVTMNSINTQEPIGLPTRQRLTRDDLFSLIGNDSLRALAHKLDELFRRHGFAVRQGTSKSRLPYTIGRKNRLFVFVCANPSWGDKVGDFIVTKEYLEMGIAEGLWKDCPIQKSGRKDDWEGEMYELWNANETERDAFLIFLEKILVETKKHLTIR